MNQIMKSQNIKPVYRVINCFLFISLILIKIRIKKFDNILYFMI